MDYDTQDKRLPTPAGHSPGSVSDIDWMPQSGQVSDAALADVLIESFYSDLYRLGLCVLEDDEQANEAAIRAIQQVVFNRRNYWGDPPLRTWLCSLVLEYARKGSPSKRIRSFAANLKRKHSRQAHGEISEPASQSLGEKLDSLSKREQLYLFFRYILHFSPEQTGKAVGARARRVHAVLNQARLSLHGPWLDLSPEDVDYHLLYLRQIEHAADGFLPENDTHRLKQHLSACHHCRSAAEALLNFESALEQTLNSKWPDPGLSAGRVQALVLEAISRVETRLVHKRFSVSLKETVLVVFFLTLVFGMAKVANIFKPEAVAPAPTRTPTQTPIGLAALKPGSFTYHYYIQPGDTLNLIAEKARVPVEAIRSLNPYSSRAPLSEGSVLILPSPSRLFSVEPPKPGTEAPPLPPLTLESSMEEIMQRIEVSGQLDRSLWVDIWSVQYGPPGYIGPPVQYSQQQIWYRPPSWTRIVMGSGQLTSSAYIINGIVFWKNSDTDEIYGQFDGEIQLDYILQQLAPIALRTEDGTIQVAGMDEVVGRPTLVLDWTPRDGERLIKVWVDTVLGLTLRVQQFSTEDLEFPVYERTVVSLADGIPLSPDIFDPSNRDSQQLGIEETLMSVQDSQPEIILEALPGLAGGRRPPPIKFPPNWFDPVQSEILLDWTGYISQTSGANSIFNIGVYADEYFLGFLELEYPRTGPGQGENMFMDSCNRSPDGRFVVFLAGRSNDPFSELPKLVYWFDLSKPLQLNRDANTLMYGANDFAISPDNRMAYWSCSYQCGLYQLNLETGVTSKIMEYGGYLSNIAWSPVGNFLAVLGYSGTDWAHYKIMVIDVDLGEIVYEGPYDVGKMEVPPDSPTNTWGIDYPSLQTWEKGCLKP
ncbi:MAG: LysM peptidoglycan-binding domain-containing protein [Chloroflexota bacterium]|nr:MAG: LysM peptidoglycan-binding domain-containing protein [Chloroflexota bacterium]